MPFNIASYALLTQMLAQQCGLGLGHFIWTGGDCDIYSNHFEQEETQLSRTPFAYPTMHIKRKPTGAIGGSSKAFSLLPVTSGLSIRILC